MCLRWFLRTASHLNSNNLFSLQKIYAALRKADTILLSEIGIVATLSGMKKCNGWQQGFTLLELVMVIAVISLLVGAGLDSWLGYRQAMLLEQNARQLMSVVARIQTQANWRNETHTAQVHRVGERWCVGPATSGGDCPADSALFFVPTSRDVKLVDATAQQFSFFGLRHTAQSGHLTLGSAAGRIRLVLSVRGRLRLCSEDQPLLGTPIC